MTESHSQNKDLIRIYNQDNQLKVTIDESYDALPPFIRKNVTDAVMKLLLANLGKSPFITIYTDQEDMDISLLNHEVVDKCRIVSQIEFLDKAIEGLENYRKILQSNESHELLQ